MTTYIVTAKPGMTPFSTVATRKEAERDARAARALGLEGRIMLDADTLTAAQIEALRAEAQDAGDTAQAVICDIAIHGRVDADGVDRLDYEDVTVRTALQHMTQESARAECARVIADAEAMQD